MKLTASYVALAISLGSQLGTAAPIPASRPSARSVDQSAKPSERDVLARSGEEQDLESRKLINEGAKMVLGWVMDGLGGAAGNTGMNLAMGHVEKKPDPPKPHRRFHKISEDPVLARGLKGELFANFLQGTAGGAVGNAAVHIFSRGVQHPEPPSNWDKRADESEDLAKRASRSQAWVTNMATNSLKKAVQSAVTQTLFQNTKPHIPIPRRRAPFDLAAPSQPEKRGGSTDAVKDVASESLGQAVSAITSMAIFKNWGQKLKPPRRRAQSTNVLSDHSQPIQRDFENDEDLQAYIRRTLDDKVAAKALQARSAALDDVDEKLLARSIMAHTFSPSGMFNILTGAVGTYLHPGRRSVACAGSGGCERRDTSEGESVSSRDGQFSPARLHLPRVEDPCAGDLVARNLYKKIKKAVTGFRKRAPLPPKGPARPPPPKPKPAPKGPAPPPPVLPPPPRHRHHKGIHIHIKAADVEKGIGTVIGSAIGAAKHARRGDADQSSPGESLPTDTLAQNLVERGLSSQGEGSELSLRFPVGKAVVNFVKSWLPRDEEELDALKRALGSGTSFQDTKVDRRFPVGKAVVNFVKSWLPRDSDEAEELAVLERDLAEDPEAMGDLTRRISFGKILGKVAQTAIGLLRRGPQVEALRRDLAVLERHLQEGPEALSRDPVRRSKFGKILGKIAETAYGLRGRDTDDAVLSRDIATLRRHLADEPQLPDGDLARRISLGKVLGKIASTGLGLLGRDLQNQTECSAGNGTAPQVLPGTGMSARDLQDLVDQLKSRDISGEQLVQDLDLDARGFWGFWKGLGDYGPKSFGAGVASRDQDDQDDEVVDARAFNNFIDDLTRDLAGETLQRGGPDDDDEDGIVDGRGLKSLVKGLGRFAKGFAGAYTRDGERDPTTALGADFDRAVFARDGSDEDAFSVDQRGLKSLVKGLGRFAKGFAGAYVRDGKLDLRALDAEDNEAPYILNGRALDEDQMIHELSERGLLEPLKELGSHFGLATKRADGSDISAHEFAKDLHRRGELADGLELHRAFIRAASSALDERGELEGKSLGASQDWSHTFEVARALQDRGLYSGLSQLAKGLIGGTLAAVKGRDMDYPGAEQEQLEFIRGLDDRGLFSGLSKLAKGLIGGTVAAIKGRDEVSFDDDDVGGLSAGHRRQTDTFDLDDILKGGAGALGPKGRGQDDVVVIDGRAYERPGRRYSIADRPGKVKPDFTLDLEQRSAARRSLVAERIGSRAGSKRRGEDSVTFNPAAIFSPSSSLLGYKGRDEGDVGELPVGSRDLSDRARLGKLLDVLGSKGHLLPRSGKLGSNNRFEDPYRLYPVTPEYRRDLEALLVREGGFTEEEARGIGATMANTAAGAAGGVLADKAIEGLSKVASKIWHKIKHKRDLASDLSTAPIGDYAIPVARSFEDLLVREGGLTEVEARGIWGSLAGSAASGAAGVAADKAIDGLGKLAGKVWNKIVHKRGDLPDDALLVVRDFEDLLMRETDLTEMEARGVWGPIAGAAASGAAGAFAGKAIEGLGKLAHKIIDKIKHRRDEDADSFASPWLANTAPTGYPHSRRDDFSSPSYLNQDLLG